MHELYNNVEGQHNFGDELFLKWRKADRSDIAIEIVYWQISEKMPFVHFSVTFDQNLSDEDRHKILNDTSYYFQKCIRRGLYSEYVSII